MKLPQLALGRIAVLPGFVNAQLRTGTTEPRLTWGRCALYHARIAIGGTACRRPSFLSAAADTAALHSWRVASQGVTS